MLTTNKMVYDVSGSKIEIFVKVFETIILFLTLSVINAVEKNLFVVQLRKK